jgi:hypothetical protein
VIPYRLRRDNTTPTSIPFLARGTVQAHLFVSLTHSPVLPASIVTATPRLPSYTTMIGWAMHPPSDKMQLDKASVD